MQSLLRQLFVGILGGAVAAAVLLAYNQPHSGPQIALAQTSTSITSPDGTELDSTEAVDADAPKVINYQGQVFDPNTGQPMVNSAFNFSFRLYNNSAGTNQVYIENAFVQTNAQGFFSTQIGSNNGFGGNNLFNIFNGQELYLGVYINDQQLSPIQPVTFVPYAFWSVHAHHLDNYDAGDFPKIAAYGVINADGSRRSGDHFSSSRQEVAGATVVVVSLSDNRSYRVDDYTTVVTPACGSPVLFGIGSSPRPNTNPQIHDMLIDIWNNNNQRVTCTVAFTVFER